MAMNRFSHTNFSLLLPWNVSSGNCLENSRRATGSPWKTVWKSIFNIQIVERFNGRGVLKACFLISCIFISTTPANPNAILFVEFSFSPRRRMLCLFQLSWWHFECRGSPGAQHKSLKMKSICIMSTFLLFEGKLFNLFIHNKQKFVLFWYTNKQKVSSQSHSLTYQQKYLQVSTFSSWCITTAITLWGT